jgi:hypothetical protein
MHHLIPPTDSLSGRCVRRLVPRVISLEQMAQTCCDVLDITGASQAFGSGGSISTVLATFSFADLIAPRGEAAELCGWHSRIEALVSGVFVFSASGDQVVHRPGQVVLDSLARLARQRFHEPKKLCMETSGTSHLHTPFHFPPVILLNSLFLHPFSFLSSANQFSSLFSYGTAIRHTPILSVLGWCSRRLALLSSSVLSFPQSLPLV